MKIVIKPSYTWIALSILIIFLYGGWYQFSRSIDNAQSYAEGLIYIEHLNSSTQRAVKLEMIGTPNEELLYHLEGIINQLVPSDIYRRTLISQVPEIDDLIIEAKADWESVCQEITQVREGEDYDQLLFASERLYNTSNELTLITTEKFVETSRHIEYIQVYLMILIGLISAIIFRHLRISYLEIKRSKELNEKMFIDTSTGLYNRSKCQEMLKDSNTPANHKSRIMIMMDLNDLKITNDQLGHQVGDELISSFANILNKAKKIHSFDVFLGRYGGDEFMAFYQSAEENDVRLYLEEVKFLADQFNKDETRFQISYAAGYAIFTHEDDGKTMRDLFDAADEKMYQNKVAMKAAKKALAYQTERMEEQQGGNTHVQ